MVRRAVASNVGNFAGVVEGSLLLSDVVPVFEALASDDQDNVRLLAVEQAGKVAKALVDQVGVLSAFRRTTVIKLAMALAEITS